MKRTISEVIDLIKEKIDNCESNEFALHDAREMGLLNKTEKEKISELVGCKLAYTDILALLESSHLVEQEKAIDIIKKNFKVSLDKYLIDTTKEEYEYTINIDGGWCTATIPKEEYDLLNEVFKTNE